MRVWRLEALSDDEVAAIVRRALDDAERGLAGALGPTGGVALDGRRSITSSPSRGGDARPALNVLEGAVALAEAEDVRDAEGRVAPSLAHVEAAAQQRILAYDRAGDGHYDTVSAFIKSLRGNDPDAALYWLASMVAAGEDPRFIVRRLIISRLGGRRQRRSAGAPGGRRGGPGARPRRPARGAVRARPGDDLHRDRAEVEPVRARLLRGRWATSTRAARCRCRTTSGAPATGG